MEKELITVHTVELFILLLEKKKICFQTGLKKL